VDQNLLVHEELSGGEARLTMLETIREYGHEMLKVHGERATTQRQHAKYFLALAEAAEPHLRGPEQAAWLLRLEREHDNLRATLAWACEAGETKLGLRLASALWWFWQLHGHLGVGRDWLERLLEQDSRITEGGEPSDDAAGQANRRALRAKALEAVGNLAWKHSDYRRARMCLEESLALYRGQENPKGISDVLNVLGLMAEDQGEFDRAVELLEESLRLRRALGAARGIGAVLNNLAIVAYHQGEYARAVPLYEEAVAVFRSLEDRWAEATTLNNLAESVHHLRDELRATTLFGASLALFRQLGDKRSTGMVLNNLGTMAGERTDYALASTLFLEALELQHSVGNQLGMIETVEELAYVCHKLGQWARAARLYGMAQAQREAAGTPMPPNQRETNDQRGAELREALGAETFAALATEGQALSVDRVLAELKA
jgi:non-specific serine/threonine protein kinase